jgi:hypothetical protein
MWPNANIPPKSTYDRANRTTNHDGSNSNGETPSIAWRRSLASATKRLVTMKWYQMSITNVQGWKCPRVLTRELPSQEINWTWGSNCHLNLKHNPYWRSWTLNLKKSHRHSKAYSTVRVC